MSDLICTCCKAPIIGNEWESCYECSAPICDSCSIDLPTSYYSDEPTDDDGDMWTETVCSKCQGLT